MQRSVRILPKAEQDASAICDWLAERSPDGALAWIKAFERGVERIASNAESFAIAVESEALGFPTRECLFRTHSGRRYRAVFLIDDHTAYILRVRGPGQPPLISGDLPTV